MHASSGEGLSSPLWAQRWLVSEGLCAPGWELRAGVGRRDRLERALPIYVSLGSHFWLSTPSCPCPALPGGVLRGDPSGTPCLGLLQSPHVAPRSLPWNLLTPPHQGFWGLVSPSSSSPACRTPLWTLTWVPSACSPPCLSTACTSPLMEPSLGVRLCHLSCTQCPPPAWVSFLGPRDSIHPPPMSPLGGLTRAPSCHAPGCPDFSPHLLPCCPPTTSTDPL